jgi:hypothetical protein
LATDAAEISFSPNRSNIRKSTVSIKRGRLATEGRRDFFFSK